MNRHALRLAGADGPFFSMLQAAAGRAWHNTHPLRRTHHDASSGHDDASSQIPPLLKEMPLGRSGTSRRNSLSSSSPARSAREKRRPDELPRPERRCGLMPTVESGLAFREADPETLASQTRANKRHLRSPGSQASSSQTEEGSSKPPSGSATSPAEESLSTSRSPFMRPPGSVPRYQLASNTFTPQQREILLLSINEDALQGTPATYGFDVDSLPFDELAFDGAHLEHVLRSETDPPWHEVVSTLSASELSDITISYDPCPVAPHLLSRPHTSLDLQRNLMSQLDYIGRRGFTDIIRYHDAYPYLWSTGTFNLLIAAAIGHAKFGVAKKLIKYMRKARIEPDVRTRQLWVRYDVRIGNWRVAWQREMEIRDAINCDMPMEVWLEFFTTPKRRAFKVEDESPRQLLDRVRFLTRHLPSLSPAEYSSMPPVAVHHVVRALIWANSRDAAISLTDFFLRHLPRRLDETQKEFCLKIIHLHLLPGWSSGLKEHVRLKKVVYSLFRHHQDLQPTSLTLFYLLRSLRKSMRCSDRSHKLVNSFVVRFGPSVLNDEVRRRLLSYAIRQNRLATAFSILRRQEEIDKERRARGMRRRTKFAGHNATVQKLLWRYAERRLSRKLAKDRRRQAAGADVDQVSSTGDAAVPRAEVGEAVTCRTEFVSSDGDHVTHSEKDI
ncbi:hypothetical protein OBBRIDRAFT_789008 [Obba rivulosa]|uniref:Uncharacterized protein n=1 Tax=Obba rivulosa TaxID=1052685 RepID=A0A8E2J4T9_9APHY|nr:hypothetical protein OBBRIDRAFT_789008 [Obba rivulosa]